jgi:uncharacterized protein DUF3795
MDGMELVTYCGLYCGLCSVRGRILSQAKTLRQSMAREGFDAWGTELPGFKPFWDFLTDMCDPEKTCPGCRQDGGPPFCSIRKCARKRGLDVCAFCDDYPCKRVEGVAKGYPTLIHDGKRMKEIGLETWIAEQKERADTGFAYVDIRCYPYEVPSE